MNDIWQPQFSILSMFLLTYAKYHLANPIFIGAEEGGGSPRSKNLRASSYVEPAPFPKRFEDFGAWGRAKAGRHFFKLLSRVYKVNDVINDQRHWNDVDFG